MLSTGRPARVKQAGQLTEDAADDQVSGGGAQQPVKAVVGDALEPPPGALGDRVLRP